MTPRQLALPDQSLPPILHIIQYNPISSCSKAPQGLSVLLRVNGIFTVIAISPGLCLRQCSDRYAIRAGRNLPDKEFRYLRTVIVTAAVHQGLISVREHIHVTFWHWAGITPYTSSYEFAESCVFGKQSPELISCGLPLKLNDRQVLSRSYDRCYAEFLKHSFPERLSILYLSTSVGLRYGYF